MSSHRPTLKTAMLQSAPGHSAVARLAWICDDHDVLMLLRRPLLLQAVLRRHHILALAPDLSAADRAALHAIGVESAPLILPKPGQPFSNLLTRRRLTQTLHHWRTTAAVIEMGEHLALATRAAASAGVADLYPFLPPLEHGTPADGAPAKAPSWRPALAMAAGVFTKTPNDQRLLCGPLASLRVPLHQMPAACSDLTVMTAMPLPALDDGLIFFALDSGDGDHAEAQVFTDVATAFDDRGTHIQFRLAETGPSGSSDIGGRVHRERLANMHASALPVEAALRRHVETAHVVVILGSDASQTLLLSCALAIGRPVVVVDDACHRDFVDVGVNGWIAPAGDAPALAAILATLLKRPDLLVGMARAARQKAERRYDQRLALKILCDVLGLKDLRAAAA